MGKIVGKITGILSIFLLIIFLSFQTPVALAVECGRIGVSYEPDPRPIPENQTAIVMKFTGLSNGWYRLRFATEIPNTHVWSPKIQAQGGVVYLLILAEKGKLNPGVHQATLERSSTDSGPFADFCDEVKYMVGYPDNLCRMTLTPQNPTDLEQIRINVSYAPSGQRSLFKKPETTALGLVNIDNYGNGTIVIGPFSPMASNLYLAGDYEKFCITPITIRGSGGASPRPLPSGSTTPLPIGGQGKLCDSTANPGIQTAIGCIHTNPGDLIADVLKFALGIGGGLAFLMMLLGAFQMLTSAGNPETLQAGKDRLTSAVIGLLFVIFAVLLLQIIGFDILGLPGFGRK